MSVVTEVSACPLCGGSVEISEKECSHCHATSQWQDYARAIEFARKEFAEWRRQGFLDQTSQSAMDHVLTASRQSILEATKESRPFPSVNGLSSPGSCWRCGRPVAAFYSYCNTCGAPLAETADTLRYLTYAEMEVTRAAGVQLTSAQAQSCVADLQARKAALRVELESGLNVGAATSKSGSSLDGDSSQTPPPIPPITPQSTATQRPHRSILEILLEPRSIQWLFASGGALLSVGLVIWLASLGVFRNPIVVAASLGAGTLVLLSAGCAMIKLTRHQLAGRALAMLACLVMPLNLWFYHAHGLVTLDGHLWLAALACCALYAAAAVILEDAAFVYVLIGGVTMTGLLILGDLHKLMQVAAPSTLLIVLSLISLHAERVFAAGEGPFSRKRFGMACFWSAHVLLGAGLILLLGAQLAGWLPMVTSWLQTRPAIITDSSQRLLALGLVLAGAYAYLYSDLVVRRVGVYIYFAAFTLLWAELLVIDLAKLAIHPAGLISMMAVSSLAVNIVHLIANRRSQPESSSKLARSLPTFGFLLSMSPVVLGIALHLRATRMDLFCVWPYSVTWSYVGAMLITAVTCRIAAYLYEHKLPRLATTYFFATAAATFVAVAGLLTMIGVKSWPIQSPLLILIPIAYLFASCLYRGRLAQRPLATIAHAMTGLLLVSVFSSALNLVAPVNPAAALHTNLYLSLFCAEAAVFYGIAAIFYGRGRDVYFSTAMACAALWQLLDFWNVRTDYYCTTFAVLGTALLLAYRLVARQQITQPALVSAAFRCANSLLSLSFIAAALLSLSRLAVDHTNWSLAALLMTFSLFALIAAGLVRHADFRRWYISVAVVEAIIMFIVVQKQIHLSPWQHLESFCVILGLILLVSGYGLWYREQDRSSDAASFCLLFGSLLAGLPLALAAIINRFGFQISLVDELGLATISTLMFLTGFMCRLRATTFVGGSLLVVHLAMLLIFAGMKAQLAVGVYLALGGAAIFALGLLLSIYRDRLLTLPHRIRQHEGIFSVLAWR